MSCDIAIRVEGLGKRYRIGGKQERYRTLRDSLTDTVITPFRAIRSALQHSGARRRPGGGNEIWALKDVSWEVRRGEVVGIIGRNGAGKSTLLKILSRITEPTTGYADVYGRVGSLLEVGTGFHPELTGRENIYLNGAILGMRRAEIELKFNDIVSFAEVEDFINTPVKHYSSGMYTRLAFAVAAHLEPEILFVDEVLAVGDAAFQKKCLGKMGEVARGGRTVLFVSHNMAAIESLCHHVAWIDKGRLRLIGKPGEVVASYLLDSASGSSTFRGKTVNVSKVVLKDGQSVPTSVFSPGDDIEVEIHYSSPIRFDKVYFRISMGNEQGSLFAADMLLDGHLESICGEGVIECKFMSVPLLPGTYTVRLAILSRRTTNHLFDPQEIASFYVTGDLRSFGFSGELANARPQRSAPLVVPYEWYLPDGTIRPVQIAKSQEERMTTAEL